MTNSNSSILSRSECSAMRGLAILCIALHNYCHWLIPAVKENEYTFSEHNVLRLLFEFKHLDWYSVPMHILSFFGHYGVPVFLFLSAYGLTKKYEMTAIPYSPANPANPDSPANPERPYNPDLPVLSFISRHFKKLFIMMLPGFIAFIIVDSITPYPHHYHLIDIIGQLGLFNNFLPNPDKAIWPGPYWFFGLMIQLYIVYRLLMYRRHWGVTVAIIAVCFFSQCFLSPESEELNYLRYNFVGSVLPFGSGLLYARYIENWFKATGITYLTICLISLVLIFFGSLWYQSWFWVPVFVCTFSISFVKISPDILNKGLAWIGGISSAIFVCHPITRKVFIHISRQGDIYTGVLIYLIATIILALGFHYLNKFINRKLCR